MNFNFKNKNQVHKDNHPEQHSKTNHNQINNQNRNIFEQNNQIHRSPQLNTRKTQPVSKNNLINKIPSNQSSNQKHTQDLQYRENQNQNMFSTTQRPQTYANQQYTDFQFAQRKNRFSNRIDYQPTQALNKRKKQQNKAYKFFQKPYQSTQSLVAIVQQDMQKQNDSIKLINARTTAQNSRKSEKNYQSSNKVPKSHQNSLNINKYLSNKKPQKQFTSKNFKEYIVNMNNIPYQQRPAVKQIQNLKMLIKYLLYLWFFMVNSGCLVSLTSKYQGICPNNAKCLVFVRCAIGYVFNEKEKTCIIDPKLAKKGQLICINLIQNLKYQNGQKDLHKDNLDNTNETIEYQISKIYASLNPQDFQDKQEQFFITNQIQDFLHSWKNQQTYNFKIKVKQGLIIISQKKYSFQTLFWLYLTSTNFLLFIALFLLGLCFGFIGFRSYKMQKKAQQIYLDLKLKLITAKVINVSLQIKTLEAQYGPINEDLWLKVDKIRNIDQRIGFYTEDFLYWKLL